MNLHLKGALKHVMAKAWRSTLKAAYAATPHSIVDTSLASLGVAAAVGSMSFATYMLVQDKHGPMVNDMQYLALFAQPRSGNAKSQSAAPDPAQFANVDMTPTGSIDPTGGPAPSSGRFRIVGGQAGVVYLSSADTIRAIRAGDTIPGVGQVAAIAWRDGSWQLLDETGRLLLAEHLVESQDSGAGRFSRGLIFGK
jgi:hypothetical protein